MEAHLMNGAMLAYVGDAYYELAVRDMLMKRGINKPNKFHKMAVLYVSATAQSKTLNKLIEQDLLTEDELGIVKKGRNVKSKSIPKNTDVMAYRLSTAFEVLIGHLYLTNQNTRLKEVLDLCFAIKDKEELSRT